MPSSLVKRQRRRKRAADDGLDPEFQVAPMVDVLLVLLLFFMSITSTELLKKVRNVQLPEAKNAVPQEKPKTNEIVVNVGWEKSNSTAIFTMDGVEYPRADALQAGLASRVQQNPRDYVLIRADKDVEYSNIADLMNTCAAAGIATVTFAVITGGEINNAHKPASGGNASASQ